MLHPTSPAPHRLAAALLALLAANPTTSSTQDAELPDAATLLAAYEQQLGAAELRRDIESIDVTGSYSMPPFGSGPFSEVYVGDKAVFRIEYPGFGSASQGTDGLMTWSQDPAMGIMVLRGDEQGAPRRVHQINGRRAAWTDMYVSARTMGVVELDGHRHYELAMQPATGAAEPWFVDVESGLVTRVDLPLPDFQGGQLDVSFEFSDWKPVGGLLVPHTRVQKVGTYVLTFQLEEVVLDGDIAPERLAPPADVLAAAQRETSTPRPGDDPAACQLDDVDERPVVSIRTSVQADAVGSKLAVLLPEVMAHIARAGVSPNGPPFSRYHAIGEDGQIDLEAGIPVSKPIDGAGRVVASTLPAGKVAVTWHVGPFDDLDVSYERLEQWIAAKQLVSRGGFWEVYWTDPGLEPDPAKWQTQIVWPVR